MKVLTKEAILRMATQDYNLAATAAEREPSRVEAIRGYAQALSTRFDEAPEGAVHGIRFVNLCSKAQLHALNEVVEARRQFMAATKKYADAERYVQSLADKHGEGFLETFASVAGMAMTLINDIHNETDRWAYGFEFTDDPEEYPDWDTVFGPDISRAAIRANDLGGYEVDDEERWEKPKPECEIPF